ncbi:MAG: DUF3836 domain-containing protein [Saprospiraceae bacterium]|nr:DUF3836 domain-containing protein [Candidatus Defluviibacterium haderslevense]
MKKAYYIAGTIFMFTLMCIFSTIHAECRKDTVITFMYEPGTSIKNNFQRTIYKYNAEDKLLEDLSQNWDRNSNDWVNVKKLNFLYNNNSIEHIYQEWNSVLNDWEFNIKYLLQYDSLKSLTATLSQMWNKTDNKWENTTQFINSYSVDHNLLETLQQSWHKEDNTWINHSKETNQYDANNYQIEHKMQGWNIITSSWINTSRYKFINDNNGNVLEKLDQKWDNSIADWVNDVIETYIYDANNNPTNYLRRVWENSNNQWENHSQFIAIYNSNNQLLEKITQNWDHLNNAWINNLKYIYLYDINFKPTVNYEQIWISDKNEWINNFMFTNEYGSDGDLKAIEYYYHWNFSANYFDYHIRVEYICTHVVNGNSNVNNEIINIYPNPTHSNFLNVILQNKSNFEFIDLTGHILKKGVFNDGNNTLALNQNIPNGLYFIKIDGKSFKVVVER